MMHKDQIDATPHAAFVFTSNERQLFEIEETDRRFHVADYVEGSVTDALGFDTEVAFINAITDELETFAKTLNRVILTDADRREIDKPEMTEEKAGLIDSSRTTPSQFVHALVIADLDLLWSLMADPLYADPSLAEEPQIKQVIATVAIIARKRGGIISIPGQVLNQMYSLATIGGHAPKLLRLLKEKKLVANKDSGYDSCRTHDPAILEAVGLSPRTRALVMTKPWSSEDGFSELLEDRFISSWIRDAIKREGFKKIDNVTRLGERALEA
jgi:hypothetical protein